MGPIPSGVLLRWEQFALQAIEDGTSILVSATDQPGLECPGTLQDVRFEFPKLHVHHCALDRRAQKWVAGFSAPLLNEGNHRFAKCHSVLYCAHCPSLRYYRRKRHAKVAAAYIVEYHTRSADAACYPGSGCLVGSVRPVFCLAYRISSWPHWPSRFRITFVPCCICTGCFTSQWSAKLCYWVFRCWRGC